MSKQEIRNREIKILLNKILDHHFEVFNKFAATSNSFYILFHFKLQI